MKNGTDSEEQFFATRRVGYDETVLEISLSPYCLRRVPHSAPLMEHPTGRHTGPTSCRFHVDTLVRYYPIRTLSPSGEAIGSHTDPTSARSRNYIPLYWPLCATRELIGVGIIRIWRRYRHVRRWATFRVENT